MVDINIGNIVTIGVISVLAVALANAALKATGVSANWLA